MTRDEFYKEYGIPDNYMLMDELQKLIYDTAEEIYDDLESRVCENCAYYENYFCQNEDVNHMFSDRWRIDARFGCNSYKPNLSLGDSH